MSPASGFETNLATIPSLIVYNINSQIDFNLGELSIDKSSVI